MKKRNRKEEKKKDFSHTPFKELKGFTAEPAPLLKGAAPETVKPAKAAEEADEREIFLRHMDGVRRLEGKRSANRPPAKPAKQAVPAVDDEEKRLFLNSLSGMDVTFRDEFPEVEPLRPLPVNRMRQLKSGAIRIDLELDLHGLTKDEALESLNRFVSGAYYRGQKAILVITGKGNNSPAEPVLQGAVASWLRHAGRKMVAEFAPAPRQMGGSGAFVVFLKDIKKAGEEKSTSSGD